MSNSRAVFTITLTDTCGESGNFDVILQQGETQTSKIDTELSHETGKATIRMNTPRRPTVIIDGDAWRDIEAADALPEFLTRIFLKGEDGEAFFESLAADLDLDKPGEIISRF